MYVVVSRKALASSARSRAQLRAGDSSNSVYEARWLLGPLFALAALLPAVGLLV